MFVCVVRDRGFGHESFSVEKVLDPTSRRHAPAFSSSSSKQELGKSRVYVRLCAIEDSNL